MKRTQITVSPWAPTPEQDAVAQRYAMGYSWNRSAAMAGQHWTQVTRWRENPAFVEYAESLRRETLLAAEPQFAGVIERAQTILLRVGDDDGDLSPTSSLALWAERILARTLWPVLVARGLAQSGLTIDRGQAVRLTAGAYEDRLQRRLTEAEGDAAG